MRRPAIVILFIFFLFEAYGQADSLISRPSAADSIAFSERVFSGELDISGRDSSFIEESDTIFAPSTNEIALDTAKSELPVPKNDILTTINYSAKDSIVFDVLNKKMLLFGDTHIDYGAVTLEADRTVVNWEKRTLHSTFSRDTTGRKKGKPVFSEGQDVYETNEIVYNFKSKRAVIKGVVTAKDGAFMHGDDVKKNEDDELFIRGARYTTCNLEHPHFFIESQKIKVIPGNKVISGPFNLKFREIPTPLWFPFGMFPQPRRKASGIIFPSYGEERVRGFFLRDMGYYFGFSEYVDLKLTGAIYSRGGHSINATSTYKVRYKFNGSFNFSYNKAIGNSGDANEFETNDYSIRWSHRPLTRGNSSFSASVSAQTQSYNVNNNVINQDFNRSINPQLSSNASYTQKFAGTPFNLGLNARHTQNLATGIVSMGLPDLTFNTARQYPLKKFAKKSSSPLTKLNFSHNFVAKNELTNNKLNLGTFSRINVVNKNALSDSIVDFNLSNLDIIYDRAKLGGQHRIPLSTSFNVLKFLTVSPSFNYQEVWYTRELNYTYVPEEEGIRIDTVQGFSRAGSWSSGASVNTRFYGTLFVKGKRIEAIRHVVTPSLSFSYNPDFGDVNRGVYDSVQVDSTGRKVRLSKYEGFAYGSPSGQKSQTVSFSLTNNLEMKVRDLKDSTQEFKKIKVFDNLAINSGYNFAADSFKLNNINWNARTSFFKNAISLNLTGTFDPYTYKLNSKTTSDNGTLTVSQRRLNQYAWNNGQGLGTLSTLNSSINFNFRPKGKGKGKGSNDQGDLNNTDFGNQPDYTDPTDLENSPYGTEDEKAYIRQNPEQYVDFNVPWSLQLRYSVNRRKTGYREAEITQSTSFSGSLGLTDNTQVTFNSGYDFRAKEFTTTRIGVSRDLHCWTMNFSYVPFGRGQSFSLVIRPKSSLLQDLKLERRRNFWDFIGD